MRRGTKWLFRGVVAALSLAVLSIVVVVIVLNTESGTRWALAQIGAIVPGKLTIGDVDGTLWRGMRLTSVSYRDEQQEITASQLDIDIAWSSMGLRRVALDTVSADTFFRRSLQPPAPTPEPLEVSMPPLPIRIDVSSLTIGEFALIGTEGEQRFNDVTVHAAEISGSTLNASEVSVSRDSLQASVRDFSMALEGDVATRGDVQWKLADNSWSGLGSVRGTLAELKIELSVESDYAAIANGSLQLLNRVDPHIDATVTWEHWRFGETELLNGEVHLSGLIRQYDAEFRTTLLLAESEPLSVSGAAAGNTTSLSKFEATMASDMGEAELNGQMDWSSGFTAATDLVLRNLNLNVVHGELNSRLGVTAKIAINEDQLLSVDDLVVTGELRNNVVEARGGLRLSATEQRCLSCVVRMGDNRLQLNGGLASGGLQFKFIAPQLDQLWPTFAGSAAGGGIVGGALDQPHVDAHLDVRDFVLNDVGYGQFGASVDGTLDQFDVTASWDNNGVSLRAEGDAGVADNTIGGIVRTATISEGRAGQWSVESPFEFSWTDDEVSVGTHRWSGENGRVDVQQIQVLRGDISIGVEIENVPLSIAASVLPANVELLGRGSADIDLKRSAGRWTGPIRWQQDGTVIRVTDTHGVSSDIVVPKAQFNADFLDGGVAGRAELKIEPGVSGTFEFELGHLASDAPLRADVQLQGNDWSWVPTIVPQIDRFDGTVNAALTADGPVSQPAIRGELTWRDGKLMIPALNVPIDEIDVVVAGASAGDVTVLGAAKAGGGTLSVDGRFRDVMQVERAITLRIEGDAAELVNWPEYHIWGSPDLELVGDANGWRFGGKLEVPKAEIEVREVPAEAVTQSPDVVVLGEEGDDARATPITGAATLLLGDRVHFKAFGLDTRLLGDVSVSIVDERPMSATGRVTLADGTFEARGQKLKIASGELRFTGPLDDPLVDVKAERVIESLRGNGGRLEFIFTVVHKI